MTPVETEAPTYEDSPRGWAQRWAAELDAAKQVVKPWHESGAKTVKRYRDERENSEASNEAHWNLFAANVQTQEASLYGQTPKVSVGRRFADAQDDVGRVAGELLERLLNSDIEKDGDTYTEALQYALQDRLLPGFGLARVRYEAEFDEGEETPAKLGPDGTELAPVVPAVPSKAYECVETDYAHWQDVLWSPARVWHEVRWVAFKAQMGRTKLVKRFGAKVGNAVPLTAKRSGDAEDDKKRETPWDRADVWEVWDKDSKRVFWWVEGYPQTLDDKPDPLGMEGFWPCPRPMLANVTTTQLLPKSDYALSQDLYEEVDELSTRIKLLTEAVSASGAYDKTAGEAIGQMLKGKGNKLVPVDNWAAFAEKGGFRGVIDWLPLEQVVGAIAILTQQRQQTKDALYEVTGMADIMRGASDPSETATAQGIKAKFGSVRLQQMQAEFARFATDVQRLKAEVIAKHYDAATILQAANVEHMPEADRALAPQAVELLKSRFSHYRVEVKPESINLTDFAALKSERMEVMQGVAGFMTAAAPLAQMVPGSTPTLLRLLQWFVSGLRGASEVEGILDGAIAKAEAAAAQPQQQQSQPDPKLVVQQMKGQQDMAKIQAETQARVVELQAEVQADASREATQRQQNVMEAAQKAQIQAAFRPQQPPGGQRGPGGGL